MQITRSLWLVITVWAFAMTGQAAGTKLYSYLAESLQKSGQANFRDFATVVGMPQFRIIFPEAYGIPKWQDFRQQQLAEGVSEERILERYKLASHIEPLTDETIGTMLMQHPTLRAYIYAYSILYGLDYPNQESSPEEARNVAMRSRSLIPLIMAIDDDYSLRELVQRLVKLMEHSFSIFFPHLPEEQANYNSEQVFDGHVGNYFFRSNFNKFKKHREELVQALYDRGYDDYDFINMLPQMVVSMMVNIVHQPLPIDSEARTIGELDIALAVNMMGEKGLLAPGFIRPDQIVDRQTQEQQGAKKALAFALRGTEEGDNDDFMQQVQTMLNTPLPYQASLFQIKQLLWLGFTMDEIAALSYWARDAIIVSDLASRTDFIYESTALLNTDGFDSDAINKAVADIGPLIFMLQQHDYKLHNINPHQIDTMMETYFSF